MFLAEEGLAPLRSTRMTFEPLSAFFRAMALA